MLNYCPILKVAFFSGRPAQYRNKCKQRLDTVPALTKPHQIMIAQPLTHKKPTILLNSSSSERQQLDRKAQFEAIPASRANAPTSNPIASRVPRAKHPPRHRPHLPHLQLNNTINLTLFQPNPRTSSRLRHNATKTLQPSRPRLHLIHLQTPWPSQVQPLQPLHHKPKTQIHLQSKSTPRFRHERRSQSTDFECEYKPQIERWEYKSQR